MRQRPVRFLSLVAALVAATTWALPAAAAGPGDTAAALPAPPRRPPKAAAQSPAQAEQAWRIRRGLYFQRNWGIEIVGVRRVSSGIMLRFDYRVVDPDLAARLSEKKSKPYLIDEATRTALAVPAMENIGELRQTGKPEVGRIYFIIFGNPGGLVKPGGRVTLVVANDRAEGLVVN